MKKTIFTLVLLTIAYFLQSQNLNFQWVKSNQGNNGKAYSKYIELDSSGNIYTVGNFSGTIDFNPSPSSVTYMTATSVYSWYIQKLDSNGNFVWVRTIDFKNGGFSSANIDHTGKLYIVGCFKDTVDIDPGIQVYNLVSQGDLDAFILKLSPNGNFIWAKSFGGSEDDNVKDIITDSQGNVYTHGYYKDTVDLDPGPGTCIFGAGYTPHPGNYPLSNAFIQKLDKNGNFIWAKTFLNSESGGESIGWSIDLDSYGNVYCSGYFSGNGIDFDPGTGISIAPSNASKEYIVKLDSLGGFIWAKHNTYIGILGGVAINSINIDRFNNLIITGRFSGNVDFDPGPDTLLLDGASSGNNWAFIQKFNKNGVFHWAKSYGRGNSTEPLSITTDTFGNVYSTGYFKDSTDLDPGQDTLMFYTQSVNWSSRGTYLQKLNSNGKLLCAGVLQGNRGMSNGWDLHTDYAGNVFATGEYEDTVDFNPGPGNYNQVTLNSKTASYILKLSQCKVYATDYVTACDSLTWMDGVTYYQSNQSANFTLPSSTGCDSIICLSLTFPVIDTTISLSNNGATFNAGQNNASYQWLDCNNGYAALPGDTMQTFTPTTNGDYAVAINVSGCIDTSACVHINNVSIEEIEGNTVRLYPNPNSGKFMLDLGNLQATEVRILNSMGQEILVMQDIKSQYFDMELNPGIYFVQIQTEKVNKTVRFVVR